MTLVPCSPAQSVSCRLMDEESLGRCYRRPGEASWTGYGESVCVCLCVDMGSGWETKSDRAINLFVFSLGASRPLLRPWRWDIYCVGPACLIS